MCCIEWCPKSSLGKVSCCLCPDFILFLSTIGWSAYKEENFDRTLRQKWLKEMLYIDKCLPLKGFFPFSNCIHLGMWKFFCLVMWHCEFMAYVQAGTDIGQWDCETLDLRRPRNSHRWPQKPPLLQDAKTLPRILLVLRKMDWAKLCNVSGVLSASEPNSCSILK